MVKKTDDGSKDRQRSCWLPVLGLSMLCLSATAVTVTSLAQEPLSKHWQERIAIEHSGNQINIGNRGGERRTYALEHQRSGKRLDLMLKRQRHGVTPGREIRFDYDAARRQIQLTVDGQPLHVVIDAQRKTVRVGTTTCPDDDFGCIQQAVGAALPDMTGEEFAALATALSDQLDDLPDRRGIRKVLQLLIDERAPAEADL